MAKKGLKHFVYGVYDPETATYKNGRVLGAISCNITLNTSDATLYVDDRLKESDARVTGGTVEANTDDIPDQDNAILFGHKIDESTGDLIANEADESPVVGWGFYGATSRNNVTAYRAIFLNQVKFGEPSDENQTKGKSIEFQTPTISGQMMMDDLGNWKQEHTFETEAEAIAWLDEKAAVAESLKILKVVCAQGTTTGTTAVTVTPEKEGSNTYKYKLGTSVTMPRYQQSCAAYTTWDEESDIKATAGQKIVVVEVDESTKALKAGIADVVIKTE